MENMGKYTDNRCVHVVKQVVKTQVFIYTWYMIRQIGTKFTVRGEIVIGMERGMVLSFSKQ